MWRPPGSTLPAPPSKHPDRGIGVFFQFGASDGVANPIKYAYNVGIRWVHMEISGNFVPFLSQQPSLGLGHEDAIELYYTAAITPWFNAALDLQIIDQAFERTLYASGAPLRDMNNAVMLGLRLYTRF